MADINNINMEKKTIKELHTLCKLNDWTGYSKFNKGELIKFCENKQKEEDDKLTCNMCNRMFCICKVKHGTVHIICDFCGDKGHESYNCVKKREESMRECFEDPFISNDTSYDIIDEEYYEENINNGECEEGDMGLILDTPEEELAIQTLFELEDLLNKKKRKEIKKRKLLDDKFNKDLEALLNNIKEKYNNVVINKSVNSYEKNKYKLFIDYKNQNGNKNENQMILYHGTDEINISPIMTGGFSLTTNTVNGTVHGKGIYFAKDINLAIKYSEKGINNKTKHILVCKVYVKNIIEGRKAKNIFPLIPNSDISEYYDTGVDNLNNPKQYIKKDVNQIEILYYIKMEVDEEYNNMMYRRYNRHNNMNNQSMNYSSMTNASMTNASMTNAPFPMNNRAMLYNRRMNNNRTFIKIVNKTQNVLQIYWNKQSVNNYNIDMNNMDCIDHNLTKTSKNYRTEIGHQIICGYFDKDRHFNIVKIINVKNLGEEFIVE